MARDRQRALPRSGPASAGPGAEAFYASAAYSIKKKPSTSEIIDWIQALIHEGCDSDRVVAEVPYLGVLLKKNEDIDALLETGGDDMFGDFLYLLRRSS